MIGAECAVTGDPAAIRAADRILLPDNAMFRIYYNEKRGASLPALQNSVAEARIGMFL